tara:strand:+ start:12133 stop:14040 length:1908 start_codon:yes stop_codon:yes gene_type:complete
MANYKINLSVNAQQAQSALRGVANTAVGANGRVSKSTAQATTAYDRMLKSAEKIGSRLMQNTQGMDSRKAVRSINEEIAAMQRLNEIKRRSAKMDLKDDLDAGRIKKADYKKESAGIDKGFDKRNTEIEILKGILDEIRKTARDELTSDKKANEKIIAANRREGVEDGNGDSMLASYHQDIMNEGIKEKDDFIGKDTRDRVGRVMKNAASSENEIFAAAALTGLIPVIGEGVSEFLGKALNEAKEYQTARGELRGLGTNSKSDPFKNDRFGADFGIKMADFYNEFRQPATRAVGNFKQGKQAGRDALLLNKTQGIDTGTVFEGMKNLRTTDEKSMIGATNAMQTTLERTGVVEKGDFSKLGEYMEVNNRLLGDQLTSLDRISSDTNLSLITGLSSMGGSFEDPRVASNVASSIDSSLKNPANDFIKAMQYDVLSRQNPGASVFDIQRMGSEGIQNRPFATGMIDEAIGSGGSQSDILLRATQMFQMQGQESMVERLITNRQAGKDIYADLSSSNNYGRKGLKGRAGDVTSPLLDNTARINDSFAVGGDALAQELDRVVSETFGTTIPKSIETVLGYVAEGAGAFGDVAVSVNKASEAIQDIKMKIATKLDQMFNLGKKDDFKETGNPDTINELNN